MTDEPNPYAIETYRNCQERARALREMDPQTSALLEQAAETIARFQRLWVEEARNVQLNWVLPLRQEIDRLTDLLATDSPERMLAALEVHHKQVVRPVSEYCKAFDDWIAACIEAHKRFEELPDDKRVYTSCPPLWDIRDHIWKLRHLDIGKSSLLNRLVYGKEELRTEMCPVHQGHWSGCHFPGYCKCQWGSDVTGWLPNE